MNYEKDFMNIPRPCPFCNPKKEDVIAENDTAYLTYSLAPYHKDHMLVIPKRHIEEILDLTEKEVSDIYPLIKRTLTSLKKEGYEDISILIRDGSNKMKSVAHMHYNIIPITRLGDIDHEGNKREILTQTEISETISRMNSVV